jgi:RND family efflux transporter MFP subunit
MKTLLRIALALLVVGGLVTGAVLLVQHKKRLLEAAPTFGLDPRPVTVARAETGTLVRTREYLAVVEAIREATVSARVTAAVQEVRVDEGDTVEVGNVLVVLDSAEVKQQAAALEARIEEAQADLAGSEATVGALESSLAFWQAETERHRALAEQEAIPKSEAERTAEKTAEVQGNLEAARRKVEAVRHRIASLRQQKEELATRLGYYRIRSPYAGVVTERLADPGDLAAPGKPLLEIEDRGGLRLAFDVPQDDLPEVKRGLEVTFSGGGETQTVPITLMHPSLNKARMMRAEARLSAEAQSNFSTGAYVSVSVVLGREEGVTLVPRSSLIESPEGKAHVFVVKDGRLAARPVQVLGYTDDRVAVEGVEPGEDVVRNTFLGWARLSAGEPVEAVR